MNDEEISAELAEAELVRDILVSEIAMLDDFIEVHEADCAKQYEAKLERCVLAAALQYYNGKAIALRAELRDIASSEELPGEKPPAATDRVN